MGIWILWHMEYYGGNNSWHAAVFPGQEMDIRLCRREDTGPMKNETGVAVLEA